jgi:hypothetical protein
MVSSELNKTVSIQVYKLNPKNCRPRTERSGDPGIQLDQHNFHYCLKNKESATAGCISSRGGHSAEMTSFTPGHSCADRNPFARNRTETPPEIPASPPEEDTAQE